MGVGSHLTGFWGRWVCDASVMVIGYGRRMWGGGCKCEGDVGKGECLHMYEEDWKHGRDEGV